MQAADILNLPENALFSKWRPKAQVIAPNSWMNDPMSMYVTRQGDGSLLYHISYQYFYARTQWGPPSQASAVSTDLVRWTDIGPHAPTNPTVLAPGNTEDDKRGIYDGTIVPGIKFRGGVAQIFTSVSHLPMGWNIPYHPRTETQSLAWSTDHGQTWQLYENNPVICNPPKDIEITGFRDPFLFTSSELDRVLRSSSKLALNSGKENIDRMSRRPNGTADAPPLTESVPPIYMALSGGNKRTGSPELMLYRNASEGITAWDYLGSVFSPGPALKWSEWSANFGHNIECGNLIRLNREGDASRVAGSSSAVDFIFGGGQSRSAFGENFWAAGHYKLDDDGLLRFVTEAAGSTDWGEGYAGMSFLDDQSSKTDRRLFLNWVNETDSKFAWRQRGWSGSLTAIKELFLKVVDKVQAPAGREKGSWILQPVENTSLVSVQTLGCRFAPEIIAAFTSAKNAQWSACFPTSSPLLGHLLQRQPTTQHYFINAVFKFTELRGRAGLTILASEDLREATHIYYDACEEALKIDRSKSSTIKQLVGANLSGKLRLWKVQQPDGRYALEPLRLSVIVDASVVQVIANDETVISFRVYPSSSHSCKIGIYCSEATHQENVSLGCLDIFEGLIDAWPNRPSDTSVPLQQDEIGVPWDGF